MTLPVATVVIPARNAAAFIGDQLLSLASQRDAPPFEVVLADNGSTDQTSEVAIRTASKIGIDLRVVDATGPASASHGRNVGAEAARGEILLFCDADDLVSPLWVGELIAATKSSDHVLVCGVLHHEHFNSPQTLAAYRIAADPEVTGESSSPRRADPAGGFAGYLHTVPGGNFAIRRENYLRIGGMDPAYPGGAEETDFAWRAQESGLTVVVAPRAVVHYRLKQTPKGLFRQQRIQQRGRVYLWTNYRHKGMQGPSAKVSLLAVMKCVLRSPLAVRSTASAMEWAYQAGAHIGALEGMLRYRVLQGKRSAPHV